MIALYSPTKFEADDDDKLVETIGRHPSGKVICREVGKPLCGVFLADLPSIGVPVRDAGGHFHQPRKEAA
jgi:hypothetical protein